MALELFCVDCKVARDPLVFRGTPNEDGSYTDPCDKCGSYSVATRYVGKKD